MVGCLKLELVNQRQFQGKFTYFVKCRQWRILHGFVNQILRRSGAGKIGDIEIISTEDFSVQGVASFDC